MKQLLFILSNCFCLLSYGQVITTFAGTGFAGFAGDSGPATAAQFNGPNSLTFDGSGNLYVNDGYNNRVRKINTAGIVTTVAGNGVMAYGGDGGQATTASLYYPASVLADVYGNIYISTNADNRIRKVNSSGIINTIAGNGILGYNGDGIAATLAQLYYPYVGAINPARNLVFADPQNYRIRRIDSYGIISTIAGNGISGYSGDGGQATAAKLKDPSWLCMSASGELYIADNLARCIRKVDIHGIITTYVGTGIAGYSGDGGPATAAQLFYPNGITIDNYNNLYISDYVANVIRKVDAAGLITTIAGNGSVGYSGDGGPATIAQLNGPNSVTVDISGNVYIADLNNNVVRKISYPSIKPTDSPTVIGPGAIDTTHVIVNHTNVTGFQQERVELYPSPVRGELTINTDNVIYRSITITNSIGQTMLERNITCATTVIDVHTLPVGIYLLVIKGEDGVKTIRFLKK